MLTIKIENCGPSTYRLKVSRDVTVKPITENTRIYRNKTAIA